MGLRIRTRALPLPANGTVDLGKSERRRGGHSIRGGPFERLARLDAK